MAESIFITKEGLEKIKNELSDLIHVQRPAVTERIKEARAHGDLSENAEYESARNQQSFIEGRIAELQDKIKRAKVVDNHQNGGVIGVGSTVEVESDGIKETYSIVGATETDPLSGKISLDSPIGKALLNHRSGQTVEVETPAGKFSYKILSVK